MFASNNIRFGICTFFCILLALGYYFIFEHQKCFQIFPNPQFQTDVYDDHIDHGNSQIINFKLTDKSIETYFKLDSGFINPYCGISLYLTTNKTLDVSQYNQLEIISSGSLKKLRLFLNTEDKFIKDQNHRLASRYHETDFQNFPHATLTVIDFKSMQTPSWWFDVMNQDKEDFEESNWALLKSISFNNGLNAPLKENLNFKIHSVRFVKNTNKSIIILATLVFVGILIAYVVIFKPFQKKNTKEIKVEYVPTITLSQKNTWDEIALNYIQTHYSNTELSLAEVAKYCGVHERKVSEMISNKYNCNFKTYINHIRITEAKRLISEKKHNISEIAYLVGFNLPSSFNRVFKTVCGMSPSEYLQSIEK